MEGGEVWGGVEREETYREGWRGRREVRKRGRRYAQIEDKGDKWKRII